MIYDLKKKTGIFSKVKQESNSIHPECLNSDGSVNEELVYEFLRGYCDRQGIKLEREKLIKNPGLHTIAKAMLKSLWGKFCQNKNNSIVKFVTLNNNKCFMMTTLDLVTENTPRVTFSQKDNSVISLKIWNVIIARKTMTSQELKKV